MQQFFFSSSGVIATNVSVIQQSSSSINTKPAGHAQATLEKCNARIIQSSHP
jgi:hypothetical protein